MQGLANSKEIKSSGQADFGFIFLPVSSMILSVTVFPGPGSCILPGL
jgi:hypothetical protein